MKYKLIFITILISLFGVLARPTLAWDDCPFGQVNDEYPGDCARFVDTDNDGICDHSQPAPEDRVAVADPAEESQIANTTANQNISNKKNTGKDYNFLLISTVLLITYFVSFSLSRLGKISKLAHKKIWNILLTLSFIFTAVLGLLLVIQVSFAIKFNFPFEMLFWHVETGIVFAVVAIFHFLWHWPYYKNLFK